MSTQNIEKRLQALEDQYSTFLMERVLTPQQHEEFLLYTEIFFLVDALHNGAKIDFPTYNNEQEHTPQPLSADQRRLIELQKKIAHEKQKERVAHMQWSQPRTTRERAKESQ